AETGGEQTNMVVDFDAPGHAPAQAGARMPFLRVLIPIAVVLLLGVLLFVLQQIMAGQQTAKVDGDLAQAQQEDAVGQEGTPAERRTHLLNAHDWTQKA